MESNDSKLIELLYTQIDNYPNLISLVDRNKLMTSSIFIPNMLTLIDREVDSSNDLLHETYSFLDMVNNLSFSIYGDSSVVYNGILSSIVNTRTISSEDHMLDIRGTKLIVVTKEDTESLFKMLESNKFLISIYYFTFLYHFSYAYRK